MLLLLQIIQYIKWYFVFCFAIQKCYNGRFGYGARVPSANFPPDKICK